MTHLPFIAAAYGLTFSVVLVLTTDVVLRTRRAKARLRALDPRAATRP